jgi:hypothetical protein
MELNLLFVVAVVAMVHQPMTSLDMGVDVEV